MQITLSFDAHCILPITCSARWNSHTVLPMINLKKGHYRKGKTVYLKLIIAVLKEAKAGIKVDDFCYKYGMNKATNCNPKSVLYCLTIF